MDKMALGLFEAKDLNNSAYHRQLPAEEHFYSSSQLKTMLDDPETFYKKYITEELEGMASIPAFDIGTYYHTSILEPHLLDAECAVYTGKVRRGKEWEAFKLLHPNKAIITTKELELAKNLVNATNESPVAMSILEGGKAELSLGIEIVIKDGGIYLITDINASYKLYLREGWKHFSNSPIEGGYRLRLKVRADKINEEDGNLIDLKSTTGNAKDVFKTRGKISNYSYDLSAAMYLDLFNAHYLKIASKVKLNSFWWIFASKDYANCKSYWADNTDDLILVGRAKWMKAVILIAKYQEMDWEIPDEPELLTPLSYEKEWIEDSKNVRTSSKHNNNSPKITKAVTEIDFL